MKVGDLVVHKYDRERGIHCVGTVTEIRTVEMGGALNRDRWGSERREANVLWSGKSWIVSESDTARNFGGWVYIDFLEVISAGR